MILRFAGFELDRRRAELRGPDGVAIKLRPKTFSILIMLASNADRVLSKQELMDAIWPNVHVGDDSLFQCIRELRAALRDDQRQLIKVVSGRGYLFTAKVAMDPATGDAKASSTETPSRLPLLPADAIAAVERASPEPTPPWRLFGLRRPVAVTLGGLSAIVALAIAVTIFRPGMLHGQRPLSVAVMPIAADGEFATMASGVTDRLIDGMSKIDNVRVVATPRNGEAYSATSMFSSSPATDLVVTGELRKDDHAWILDARLTRTATQEVQQVASISVDLKDQDIPLQQSRLAAGIGDPLALRINKALNPAVADDNLSPGGAKAAIEQATASIVQTSPERFAAAQTMLEKALTDEPDNTDLQVALAALQLRGVQMVWYSPAESQAAQTSAKAMLERAVRTRPTSVPVLEAYCRFLSATNQFAESLVACARTLSFDPWNGLALYLTGLGQLNLGRFEDAFATFQQADRFDTPQVSRWTWLLGAGWTDMMMGRAEDAVPWLQRSIAITPASGRSQMLLAAAYQQLGRTDEAQEEMREALKLRPGTTALNVGTPTQNSSPAFVEAGERVIKLMVAAGLPPS
jgi:DNA-binding winged helix-turn-helix (wHTH) protein/tetratricopeptide (TPR) repeat protein